MIVSTGCYNVDLYLQLGIVWSYLESGIVWPCWQNSGQSFFLYMKLMSGILYLLEFSVNVFFSLGTHLTKIVSNVSLSGLYEEEGFPVEGK